MELIIAILSNSTTHLLAVCIAALCFKKQIAHHFMGLWMVKVDHIADVQKQREEHYKEIPLMKMEINHIKEWKDKSDERYEELDKKIDNLTNVVTELAALVKQDLASKSKGE